MPVFVLFYAFGITNDKEIIDMCSMKDKRIESYVFIALQNF